jgi:thiamine biosynthesis protein ThiI
MKNALLLISGGFDSPVAGKLAIEKGYKLKAIHFSQEPFADSTPEKKSLALSNKLGIKEVIVVDAGEMLKNIADNTYREYYFVLMKRFFMKVSEKIAQKENCEFLVTGESIGQVSSQTMSNLDNINNSVSIEILRPLLFTHKQVIIDFCIREGYYEISKGPEMCDALASGHPKTQTKLNKILEEEDKCNMKQLVEDALKKIRIEKTDNIKVIDGKVCTR